MSMARHYLSVVSTSSSSSQRPGLPKEDEVYSLKEQNQTLKKQINDQDDKTKKLMVKIQKLSQDLARAQSARPDVHHQSIKQNMGLSKRDELEAYDLIDDLRTQVKELSKSNSGLKNRVHFFKALHEAETRKRTPYDHIPPRIVTGSKPKRAPSVNRSTKGYNERRVSGNHDEVDDSRQEQIDRLEELTNMLRLRLSGTEQELEEAKLECARLNDNRENLQRQDDIDRLSLQHELVELKRQVNEYRVKAERAEGTLGPLQDSHDEAMKLIQKLTSELKSERLKTVELQHELKQAGNHKNTEKDLLSIIDDLRAEIRSLEEEQARLMQTRFGAVRDEQYQEEVQKLQKRIAELEKQIADHLKDKVELSAALQTMAERLKIAEDEKSATDKAYFTLKHELEELREKLKFLNLNGDIDISEINEALAMLQKARHQGVSIDFLDSIDDLQNDKKLLLELRAQYAECVQDFEKTKKLLHLQEQINKEQKIQLEKLKQRLETMKNEYELRLEEDSRLLDLRGHKISQLEAQLKNIVYGTAKVPVKGDVAETDADMDLAKGQNIVDIHVEAGLFNDEAITAFHDLALDNEDAANMTTFVVFDFFEFETQVSPLGLGLKPRFGHTSRFQLYADDFFLHYLQSSPMKLTVCRLNGLDFVEIGYCVASFQGILKSDKANSLQYYADIISVKDDKTILGKLDYSIKVHVPMSQAIRTFKERTVALNLLTVSDKEEASQRFQPRAAMNHLNVELGSLKGLEKSKSTYYASFSVQDGELIVSESISPPSKSDFGFVKMVPLFMGTDLDRYLRSTPLKMTLIDETLDQAVGHAEIPLVDLALNESVQGEFIIMTEKGQKAATLEVSLHWENPYKPDIVPVVSLIDQKKESKEFKGNTISEGHHSPEEKSVREAMTESSAEAEKESQQILPIPSTFSEVVMTDSIQASIDQVTSSQDLVSFAQSQLTSHAGPHEFVIGIRKVTWDFQSPLIDDLLNGVSQIFVSFDFLSFPPEELETHSCSLEGSQSDCLFAYSKTFQFPPDSRLLFSLSRFLKSPSAPPTLVFAVVSEPPPDAPDESCQDLCFAKWNLLEACLSGVEGSLKLALYNSLENNSKTIQVGWLEIDWSGHSLLSSIKDSQ